MSARGITLSVIRLATSHDAADVARLMIGFRDRQGRHRAVRTRLIHGERAAIPGRPEHRLPARLGEFRPPASCQLRFRHAVWTGMDDAHLEDLFVSEDARGSGIGRELVEAAMERARERRRRADCPGHERVESGCDAALRVGRLHSIEEMGGRDLLMRAASVTSSTSSPTEIVPGWTMSARRPARWTMPFRTPGRVMLWMWSQRLACHSHPDRLHAARPGSACSAGRSAGRRW